jgi:hypothetical protein
MLTVFSIAAPMDAGAALSDGRATFDSYSRRSNVTTVTKDRGGSSRGATTGMGGLGDTAAANPTGANVNIPRYVSSNARVRDAGRGRGGAQQRGTGTDRGTESSVRQQNFWVEMNKPYDSARPRVGTSDFGAITGMANMGDQVFARRCRLNDHNHGGACIHIHLLEGDGCPRRERCPFKHDWYTRESLR